MKIYVPDLEKYEKYVLLNENTIRAYATTPQKGVGVNYRDYYINSHYIYKDGVEMYTETTENVSFLDESILTNEIYYRNDFDSILIIFFIVSFVCIYIPIKIVMRMFKKR